MSDATKLVQLDIFCQDEALVSPESGHAKCLVEYKFAIEKWNAIVCERLIDGLERTRRYFCR